MLGKISRWFSRRRVDIERDYWKRRYGAQYVPTVLNIALTNRCNADCVYCRREHKVIHPDMDLELYREIVRNTPFIRQVQPQIVGEPFLYRWWPQAVRYAKEHGKYVVLYTNGALVTDKVITELMATQPNKIVFSVDESYKEGFENLRRRVDFDIVVDNIRRLREMRDLNKLNIKLTARICITPENRHRIVEIKKFWAEYVDEVAAEFEQYMPTQSECNAGGLRTDRPINCKLSYDGLVIETNGDMLFCCSDFFNTFELGNINNIRPLTPEKILALFNNSKVVYLRATLKRGIGYPYKCHVCQGRTDMRLER